jgi:hypothetical protein
MLNVGETRPITRGSVSGRAIVERGAVHIPDYSAIDLEHEFPDVRAAVERQGICTCLGMPLLREGVPIGAIVIRRTELRPFSETQIALLKSFADQAVIAVENVRLFTELGARTQGLSAVVVDELRALGDVSRADAQLDPGSDTVLKTIVTRPGGAGHGTDSLLRSTSTTRPRRVFGVRAAATGDPADGETLDPIGRATPIPRGLGASSAKRSPASRQPVQVSRHRQCRGSYESPVRAPPSRCEAGHPGDPLTVPLVLEERMSSAPSA